MGVSPIPDTMTEKSSKIYARLPFWTYEYAQRVYDTEYASPSVTCATGGGMKLKVRTDAGIREMTPREYWRLMGLSPMNSNGFDDAPYEMAAKINSPSQLYKQAGNSICPDVLEAVFEVMLFN